jgi:hypothetical protein
MLALACVVVTVAGTSVPAMATINPTATVTPGTAVTDGQIVTVNASGLPANRTIQVEECAGTVDNPPTDNTSCDGVTLDSSTDTDPGGVYANSGYTVYTRPSSLLSSPATITCDAGHACVLYVGVDQNNFSAAHAFAALTFSDSVTTTTTAPTTTTTTGATTSTTGGATTTTTVPGTTTTEDTMWDDQPPRSTTTTLKKRTTTTTGSASGAATTTTGPSGSNSTVTTVAGEGPAPTVTTVSTAPGLLHDSGGGNSVLGSSPDGNPGSVPMLPLTGAPHGAALVALGGLAVVVGGSEVRRRALRPRKDGPR